MTDDADTVWVTIRVDIADLDLSKCKVYPPNGLHDEWDSDLNAISVQPFGARYTVIDTDFDKIEKHLITGKQYERDEMLAGREDMAKH